MSPADDKAIQATMGVLILIILEVLYEFTELNEKQKKA